MVTLDAIGVITTVLQFIGVFVSFSIATVSYIGLRKTESSTLLRLTTAFIFLGVGFAVEGLVGLGNIIPQAPATTATALVAGLLLETMGYFFLAFSHAVDVMLSRRLVPALLIFPVISMGSTQLSEILGLMSFYFILYGFVETLYSYKASKNPDTLLIACGLAMIAVGTFTQWLSVLYISVNILPLIEIIVTEMGLMMLFVPVIGFAIGRDKKIGTI
jgi:hypothetical protein